MGFSRGVLGKVGHAACFPSAGQLCVSIERLYVADEIHDAFVATFVERTQAMRLGVAYDFSVDMGSDRPLAARNGQLARRRCGVERRHGAGRRQRPARPRAIVP